LSKLRTHLIPSIIFTVLTSSLWGQNISALGRFSVDFSKGCAQMQIQITDISGSPISAFQYEGNSSTPTNLLNYTYTVPGTYIIIQTIQDILPRQDSLVIEVLDPLPPEFNILTCENEGVVVQITDSNYDGFVIDYGDMTNITITAGQSVPNHFYSSSGSYNITVKGLFNNGPGNCGQTAKQINTITSIFPATIQTLQMAEDKILLSYSLPQNIFYNLEITINNNNNFQKLKAIDNSSTQDSIIGLNPSITYCFRITSFDPCNSNTISSNVVCSIEFDLDLQNNQNLLSWTTLGNNISDFSIERDNQQVAQLIAGQSNYTDQNLICNIENCYLVRVNYSDGGVSSTELLCGTSFSTDTPDSIDDLSVSVVANDEIRLSWLDPVNFVPAKYLTFQSIDKGSFKFLDSLQSTNFNNTGVSPDNFRYCYKVDYIDQCGNSSISGKEVCAIILTSSQLSDIVNLQWSDYNGWSLGVNNYLLEKFDQNGNLLSSNDIGNNLNHDDILLDSDGQLIIYQVTAFPNDISLSEAKSNIREVSIKSVLNLPNAFTPNGDGLNDVFMVNGKFINTFTIKIFSKWGELIFFSNDVDLGWDGNINGELAPQGTYAYIVEATDLIGNILTRSGLITLLK